MQEGHPLYRETIARITRKAEPKGEVRPWDPPSVLVVKSLLYPLAAAGSLWLALWICREPFHRAYYLAAVLAFIATSEILSVAPLQYLSTASASARGFLFIARRWFAVIAFLWALISVSGLQANFQPRVWLAWALLTPVVLWLSELAARRAFELALSSDYFRPHDAIIVGLNDLGRLLERKLREDRSSRVRVVAYFDDQEPHVDTPGAQCREIGELHDFIRSNAVRIVYITWPMTRERRILELLDILRDSTASIYFVPDVSIVNLIQGRLAVMSGLPVLGVCESPLYGIRAWHKRAFDIVFCSLLLVLAAPVLVAVAIGVRVSSPGPILFRQRRYGLDGREFMVYKFRSMIVTEDGDSNFFAVERGDQRVTPFGAFIRRTSLDELPQLLNVLGGTMSLVGPRPHVVSMNEAYRSLISGYMLRHKVRPGITGWAQVNGSRGGNDLEDMKRRLELDLEYLKHWSLRLDLVILLRTVDLLLSDPRAY
jgi:putative colanic acid biosynthesis UDP-glucose lipid carrier transferase